jgi:hypothetical protein
MLMIKRTIWSNDLDEIGNLIVSFNEIKWNVFSAVWFMIVFGVFTRLIEMMNRYCVRVIVSGFLREGAHR